MCWQVKSSIQIIKTHKHKIFLWLNSKLYHLRSTRHTREGIWDQKTYWCSRPEFVHFVAQKQNKGILINSSLQVENTTACSHWNYQKQFRVIIHSWFVHPEVYKHTTNFAYIIIYMWFVKVIMYKHMLYKEVCLPKLHIYQSYFYNQHFHKKF